MRIVDGLLEFMPRDGRTTHLHVDVGRDMCAGVHAPFAVVGRGVLLHRLGNLHTSVAAAPVAREKGLIAPGAIEHTLVASLFCRLLQTVGHAHEEIVVVAGIQFVHPGLQALYFVGSRTLGMHLQSQQA